MELHSDDYDEDDEEDEYSELPEDILNEIEYDFKINCIIKFKKYIINEPEFIGIKNISASNILHLLENTKDNNDKKFDYLSNYQVSLFDNLYKELYNDNKNKQYYNIVCHKLFNHIYCKF